MMKRETFEIARIHVPVKRRATLEPDKVAAWAQGILMRGARTLFYCERTTMERPIRFCGRTTS